ncbi:MAG: flagellar motor switch protein FliG [Clostridiales bacterium]|nr:flagellar motor switch protein FliG [Clostridiales bacterium]MCF8021721.1 flagellar motor switch protein FliG [Clostridiales bacterium]
MCAVSQINGLQKASILLISLGSDLSARILKEYFHDEDIEKISQQISMMDNIPSDTQEKVLDEFVQLGRAREYMAVGGQEYAYDMLDKAVGKEKARVIMEKVSANIQERPFSNIRKIDPRQLVNFIKNEHPQTIALILTYLDSEQASMVLSELPQEFQADIAKRVALIDRVPPEVLENVEEVLEQKLSVVTHHDESVGGVKTLVDILNKVDRPTEKTILEELEIQDTDLAENIRNMLFVFEDIVKLPDASIQRVLREVDSKDLSRAIKGSNQEVAEAIYRNMSKRASDMLKDEIKYMGPVRLREVETSQQNIVQIIRQLDESGEIIIARGGEDAVLT